MAKLWAFCCYLTCLTLFCHFVSHAHQEMTDFFTGIHRPRKTTTTKTAGRFTRSFQLNYLKDSLPYVQLFYFGKKKYEPAYNVKKLTVIQMYGPARPLSRMVIEYLLCRILKYRIHQV